MNSHKTFPRAAALRHQELTIRIHQLIREGRDETPEADLIDEQLFSLWEEMSEAERELAHMLSGDLYSLEGSEKEVRKPSLNVESYRDEVFWVLSRRDGRALLDLLQHEGDLSETRRAFARARAWEMLGYMEAAIIFASLAHDLEPSNPRALMVKLRLMMESDHLAEAVSLAEEMIAQDPPMPIELMFVVVDILHADAEKRNSIQGRIRVVSLYREALRRALPVLQQIDSVRVLKGLMDLGFTELRLGRYQGVTETFETATAYFPQSDIAQTARGWWYYKQGNMKEARVYFHNAIRIGTQIPHAYWFNAVESANVGDFAAALSMLRKASTLTGDFEFTPERLAAEGIDESDSEAILRLIKRSERSLEQAPNLLCLAA